MSYMSELHADLVDQGLEEMIDFFSPAEFQRLVHQAECKKSALKAEQELEARILRLCEAMDN